MIPAFLEKWRLRRIFGAIVDPAAVESLLGDGLEQQPPKHARIEFVLAFVRGDNPMQVSERMGQVADLALKHDAIVYDLVSGLVIMAFGAHPQAPAPAGGRASLVQALREQLAGDVKVVHGAADGHYGLFGSDKRPSYTFVVPHFDAMLGTFSRLQFGESEEFKIAAPAK